MEKECDNCKYEKYSVKTEPCDRCNDCSHWESKEEVTSKIKDSGSLKLKDFYAKQAQLDKTILNNMDKPIGEKELLCNTMLALQVEVSELANATRCFKHWSRKGSENKEVILDEYADVMHFFLSIGNQLGFTPEEVEQAYLKKHDINYDRQKNGY